jgi:hypothetical protein
MKLFIMRSSPASCHFTLVPWVLVTATWRVRGLKMKRDNFQIWMVAAKTLTKQLQEMIKFWQN